MAEGEQPSAEGERTASDEIRAAAADGSWSLASDEMLLQHLERFGRRLGSRADDVQRKLAALKEDIRGAEDSLGTITNEFLFLANEQFIENRVYDDSDPDVAAANIATGSTAEESGPASREEVEADFAAKTSLALREGQTFLDTGFQNIKVLR